MGLTIVLIVVCLFAFSVLLAWLGAEKLTHNCVKCFTGGLGCGKTYLAVTKGVASYKSAVFKWQLKRLFWTVLRHADRISERPLLYSNIPIQYAPGKWSHKLLREHLLMEKRVPLHSVLVVDEIGQLASQWEYDNPNVMEQLQEFVRLFRHYVDGQFYMTDQASSNVVKQIRCRVNRIYNLDDFRRYWGVLPLYKIDVNVISVSEETLVNTNPVQTVKEGMLFTKRLSQSPYFMGFLPYKFQRKKRMYDSRCYSEMYKPTFEQEALFDRFKADYFIDLGCSADERKAYKNRNKQ